MNLARGRQNESEHIIQVYLRLATTRYISTEKCLILKTEKCLHVFYQQLTFALRMT